MTRLVGYVRKTTDGTIKLSINVNAFGDCDKYKTSDKQEYVALVINNLSLNKVLNGTKAVTVIQQEIE